MTKIKLAEIEFACRYNASISQVIKQLKLFNFKLFFDKKQGEALQVKLTFDNVRLTAEITCNLFDYEYLAYLAVNDGWQIKILR